MTNRTLIDKIIDWFMQFTPNKRYNIKSIPFPKKPAFITVYDATPRDLDLIERHWNNLKVPKESIFINGEVKISFIEMKKKVKK